MHNTMEKLCRKCQKNRIHVYMPSHVYMFSFRKKQKPRQPEKPENQEARATRNQKTKKTRETIETSEPEKSVIQRFIETKGEINLKT